MRTPHGQSKMVSRVIGYRSGGARDTIEWLPY